MSKKRLPEKLRIFGAVSHRTVRRACQFRDSFLPKSGCGKVGHMALDRAHDALAAHFIAEQDGETVGVIRVCNNRKLPFLGQQYYDLPALVSQTSSVAKVAVLDRLFVQPLVARSGIGSALVVEAFEWATAAGYRWAVSAVAPGNEGSKTLIRRLGFQEWSSPRGVVAPLDHFIKSLYPYISPNLCQARTICPHMLELRDLPCAGSINVSVVWTGDTTWYRPTDGCCYESTGQ